jgi:hypothetical protein
MPERLVVAVSFNPVKGYIGSAPDLRQPVTALSLGGLRRRIECCPTTSTLCCTSTAPRLGQGVYPLCGCILRLFHHRVQRFQFQMTANRFNCDRNHQAR